MIPRPPDPPVEPKPALPILNLDHPPSEPVTERLLASAATGEDLSDLFPHGLHARWSVFLGAIDASTGDSALHRAAAAGNVVFIRTIMDSFGRQVWLQPRLSRLAWVLWTHQNLDGDTALHAAARAGSLHGVRAVYRAFHFEDIESDDRSAADAKETPSEFWVWDGDPSAPLPALVFVCTKNKTGRDAAEEARIAGHDEVAEWVDGLAKSLDHDDMKADEDYMRKARQAVLEAYHFR